MAACAWAVNTNTLGYGFVYDDHAVILERPSVVDEGLEHFMASRHWGAGRQLTLLSFDLQRRDPPEAGPYHRANAALAVLAAVLVLALGWALSLPAGAALVGALLFAVHPLHVNAIVSIVGRAELLAAIFALLVVLVHIADYRPWPLGLLVAMLLFAAGLSSKESAACIPLLIVVYDFFLAPPRPWRRRIAVYVAYACTFAAWLWLSRSNLAGVSPIVFVDNPLAFMPAWERVLRACEVLWRYLSLLVCPIHLRADRSFDATSTTIAGGAIAALAWLAVGVYALALRGRAPRTALLTVWFVAAFAATANIAFPIGTIMAERLAYLPSAPACLLAGVVVARLGAGGRLRRWSVHALAVLAVIVLAFAYDARARVWAFDGQFYRQTVIDAPHSAKAHYNLGLYDARQGRMDAAIRSLRRALAIYPAFDRAAVYLVAALSDAGRKQEASETFDRYLAGPTDDASSASTRAALLARLGRFEDARRMASRAVELAPGEQRYIERLNDLESLARRRGNGANTSP